jgi:thymidylate synthase ThyX
MPPEKLAYALARYSRSPDSIRDSIEWVRTHDSSKFLESFYFQYGHASIADLGHVTICFEGVSEIAAAEIEDEQLWDGQARSSRYQDFSASGVIVPPELTPAEASFYNRVTDNLLQAYREVKERASAYLHAKLPRPEAMKPDAYQRNLTARAFDIARYLLPFGVSTGVGQVTSIRTLEKQIRRLKASEFGEVRGIGDELAAVCAALPECAWDKESSSEPVAPTLARYAEREEFPRRLRADLAEWATHHLPPSTSSKPKLVDILQPTDQSAELCASLLYPVTDRPYRELYEIASALNSDRRKEIFNVALGSRSHRDELPRQFRGAPYVLDITMDIGAYRDLHRHRRCHQLRQPYTNQLGYSIPSVAAECGAEDIFRKAFAEVDEALETLPRPAADYVLPFAAKSRFLFKMDFAELEYISRLRSGVKGHFSYREIAWHMKKEMEGIDPMLGSLIEATPPWIEDPLTR